MSFEKKKPKNYEIDIEYQSVYADGVIVSPDDNDTAKLVFYENVYKFDPNSGYDKDKKISRLKFEVKVSSYVLEKLTSQLINATLSNQAINFMKIQQMNKLKPSVVKEIEKLSEDVTKKTFDTDNPVYNKDLEDIFQSVMARMMKDIEDG
jgi:hypothetical protein